MVAGSFDILSHVMETYFSEPDEDNVSDDISEALMRGVITSLRAALVNPEDYTARSNLMWLSTMAENRIIKLGKNVILNAIPVYIGFRYIGKKFTGYSCLMILLSGILTDLLPGYSITSDTLLISIFGGIINGSVMSLCLFGNATTGGTDFIAIFLSVVL